MVKKGGSKMITSRDVRKEMEIAEKKVKDPKIGVRELIAVLIKLVTVLLKVILSVRVNTKLLMVKMGVKPIVSKRNEVKKDDQTKENNNEK
jgi:hypothetical protein